MMRRGIAGRDTLGPVRLLLVEDDSPLASIIERGLTEMGHAVDWVRTVADATENLRLNDYDLAVLDLGLPDGDGVELCRRIRSNSEPRTSATPILMLTARDSVSDRVQGLDAGADDYLPKPFDYEELGARVRALLRRPKATNSPVLTVGDVTLDPAAHTVLRGVTLVPLTAREFSLLDYLMRHVGEVCRREQLLDHVWDANYDGLSNVVDVHIANLRRKLDLPGSPNPIETVRGVGYRMSSGVDT